jgi:hypothetical protein
MKFLELTKILSKSRDPEELKHVWLEWRNAVGPKCRELYQEYVQLSNLAATMNSEYLVIKPLPQQLGSKRKTRSFNS